MISETEFAELGNSLSTGFFADKVVISLARTQRLHRLQEGDRATIKDAYSLLHQVLEGEKWLEKKVLTSRSTESALAFDRAVHAVPLIAASASFVAHIKKLKKTMDHLLKTGTATDTEIQNLRRFFFGFARAVSTESQRVIDRSSEPQGVVLWAQLDRETT